MPQYRVTNPDQPLIRRCRIEVLVLAIASPLFLTLAPRNALLYMLMALLFAAFILANSRTTKLIRSTQRQKTNKSTDWFRPGVILILTIASLVIFIVVGYMRDAQVNLLHWGITILVYITWALLQQFLFLYYFLGRLVAAFQFRAVVASILLTAVAYGAVHLPDYPVFFLTTLASSIWAASYYFYQRIWPIALSHGVLGASYYYWVSGRDLWSEWLVQLGV